MNSELEVDSEPAHKPVRWSGAMLETDVRLQAGPVALLHVTAGMTWQEVPGTRRGALAQKR